jgi:hypothetical protein
MILIIRNGKQMSDWLTKEEITCSERRWKWFCIIVLSAIAIFILLLLMTDIECIYTYNHSTPEEIHAQLENIDYNPSTVKTHLNPTTFAVSGKVGVAATFHTTGHDEEFTTVWITKEYGRLKSDKKEVWQYAKPESILLIKQWLGDPYIDNIKKDMD